MARKRKQVPLGKKQEVAETIVSQGHLWGRPGFWQLGMSLTFLGGLALWLTHQLNPKDISNPKKSDADRNISQQESAHEGVSGPRAPVVFPDAYSQKIFDAQDPRVAPAAQELAINFANNTCTILADKGHASKEIRQFVADVALPVFVQNGGKVLVLEWHETLQGAVDEYMKTGNKEALIKTLDYGVSVVQGMSVEEGCDGIFYILSAARKLDVKVVMVGPDSVDAILATKWFDSMRAAVAANLYARKNPSQNNFDEMWEKLDEANNVGHEFAAVMNPDWATTITGAMEKHGKTMAFFGEGHVARENDINEMLGNCPVIWVGSRLYGTDLLVRDGDEKSRATKEIWLPSFAANNAVKIWETENFTGTPVEKIKMLWRAIYKESLDTSFTHKECRYIRNTIMAAITGGYKESSKATPDFSVVLEKMREFKETIERFISERDRQIITLFTMVPYFEGKMREFVGEIDPDLIKPGAEIKDTLGQGMGRNLEYRK